MSANERQVGGNHYKNGGEEHWDRVERLGLDYFQACVTKYVERCWKKNGIQDLEKARHFLDKYIEIHKERATKYADDGVKGFPIGVPEIVYGTDRPQHPIARDYGAEMKPTGWVGFTFEGADADGFLFTCEHCREKLRIPPHSNPHAVHLCQPQ